MKCTDMDVYRRKRALHRSSSKVVASTWILPSIDGFLPLYRLAHWAGITDYPTTNDHQPGWDSIPNVPKVTSDSSSSYALHKTHSEFTTQESQHLRLQNTKKITYLHIQRLSHKKPSNQTRLAAWAPMLCLNARASTADLTLRGLIGWFQPIAWAMPLPRSSWTV